MTGDGTRTPIDDEVASRIRRRGPLPFSEVMDLALYEPEHGFYAAGGHAGRRGDFITSPEAGPLFGAVVARYLDEVWTDLGRPDPFVVVEAGAGIGTLAIAIRAAAPECLPAVTYVLVEQSSALRDRHRDHLDVSDPALAFAPRTSDEDADDDEDTGATDFEIGTGSGPGRSVDSGRGTGPRFVSLADLPMVPIVGVVLANELLDNLPFEILAASGDGWNELRVALDADDRTLIEFAVPADDALVAVADQCAAGTAEGGRIPIQLAAAQWLRTAGEVVERGRVLILDYGAATADLATRTSDGWLRTYREQARGGAPLEALGTQDITADLAVDQLTAARSVQRQWLQADFLRAHGIEALVEDGRRIWNERAHIGDLEAIKARSRVGEADALLDPDGLGAFLVLEWRVGG